MALGQYKAATVELGVKCEPVCMFCDSMVKQGMSPVEWLVGIILYSLVGMRLATPSMLMGGSRLEKPACYPLSKSLVAPIWPIPTLSHSFSIPKSS